MSSPAASAETDPTKVTVDPQDPTPEPSWKFRRWYVFAGRGIICIGVAFIVWFIRDLGKRDAPGAINSLTYIALTLLGWGIMESAIYLIGPSAEQFGLWVKTVGATIQGAVFRSRSTAQTADGKVTVETTAGKPAAPLEPEKPLAPSDPTGSGRPADPAPTETVGLRPRERGTE